MFWSLTVACEGQVAGYIPYVYNSANNYTKTSDLMPTLLINDPH